MKLTVCDPRGIVTVAGAPPNRASVLRVTTVSCAAIASRLILKVASCPATKLAGPVNVIAVGKTLGEGLGFDGGGGGVTGGFGVEGTDELPPAPPPPPPPPLGTPPPAPPSPPAAVSISPRSASLALSSLLSPAMGLLTAISNTRFPGSGGFDSPTKISPSEEIARPVAPVPLISPLACC